MNQIGTKLFVGWTYEEITIELLLNGFLSFNECIKKRIEFDNNLKSLINKN